MNKISGLRRLGMIAVVVVSGFTGVASAAELFREEFNQPTEPEAYDSYGFGNCNIQGLPINSTDPFWRHSSLRFHPRLIDHALSIKDGKLAISSNDTGGTGITSRLDSRFDFLSPGNKRKFVVKDIKVSGAGDDPNGKMFRFIISSHQCGSIANPHIEITAYANGQFNVSIGKPDATRVIRSNPVIDMDYSLPMAADQVELTLDNTNYELSFVFNVPASGIRPAYQGAFSYRGPHGLDRTLWSANWDPLPVGYPSSVSFYAAALSTSYKMTDVTIESFSVTDGAP